MIELWFTLSQLCLIFLYIDTSKCLNNADILWFVWYYITSLPSEIMINIMVHIIIYSLAVIWKMNHSSSCCTNYTMYIMPIYCYLQSRLLRGRCSYAIFPFFRLFWCIHNGLEAKQFRIRGFASALRQLTFHWSEDSEGACLTSRL